MTTSEAENEQKPKIQNTKTIATTTIERTKLLLNPATNKLTARRNMSIQQTASVLPSMHASRNAALLAKVRQLEACVEGLAAKNNRLAAQLSAEAIKNKELTEELSLARSAAFQTHVDLLPGSAPRTIRFRPSTRLL